MHLLLNGALRRKGCRKKYALCGMQEIVVEVGRNVAPEGRLHIG
jgi:hypothetical protein